MSNLLHQPMDWETSRNEPEEMEWVETKKKKGGSKNRANFWKRES